MKNFRRIVLVATYAGAMLFSLLAPAFAQQEIDPTWYDPWAKPAAPVSRVVAISVAKPHKIGLISQNRPKHKKAAQPETIERAALVRR